jgi:hypothetical protein
MTPPAAAAAPAVNPRRTVGPGRGPLSVPHRPRRVSGPARRPVRARPSDERRARQPPRETGLVLGLTAALERLSRSRLLDRLTQGRLSIALVAFALIGIVTMQLGLLKLNAGIGRALEHEALLQRENAALSIENSEMAAGDRVELQAGRLGMGLISPGALRFLSPGSPSLQASRAAAALSAPLATSSTGTISALSAGATTSEGSSGAGESETASGGNGETSGEASSAAPASVSPSGSASAAPSSEAARETTSASATTAEAAGSAPTSSVSPVPASSGPSGGAGEAAAGSSAPTGGGATAPSG